MARNGCFSRGEDPKIERPRHFKACYCGNHHCNKKNLHHHSTYMRYSYRLLRQAKMRDEGFPRLA